MTGGRLKRFASYLQGEETFCFTYGDGVADIDITAQLAFHRQHGKRATVTAVQPKGRYGALDMESGLVRGFIEKPQGDGGWVNGGYFVLSLSCIDLITDDHTIWEGAPLTQLANQGELMAYEHSGFWQPMDTVRDKTQLEEIWQMKQAPWKVWK